jgi:hypothetical protein
VGILGGLIFEARLWSRVAMSRVHLGANTIDI